jgi:DNA-binding NarL/FixJ family response regulator
MAKTTILLVDDHPVVRQGLKSLLAIEPSLEIVGEAGDGWDALAIAKEKQPNIVIMDLALPRLDGVETTRKIRREVPNARVLVLTTYSHDRVLERALNAGAAGFVLKQTAAQDLMAAIRKVLAGGTVLRPTLEQRIEQRARRLTPSRRQPAGRMRALTLRETQVLQLIADGLSNRQIATELGISAKTVEKHRQSLMNKIGIHETAGLTRYALDLENS